MPDSRDGFDALEEIETLLHPIEEDSNFDGLLPKEDG